MARRPTNARSRPHFGRSRVEVDHTVRLTPPRARARAGRTAVFDLADGGAATNYRLDVYSLVMRILGVDQAALKTTSPAETPAYFVGMRGRVRSLPAFPLQGYRLYNGEDDLIRVHDVEPARTTSPSRPDPPLALRSADFDATPAKLGEPTAPFETGATPGALRQSRTKPTGAGVHLHAPGLG